MPNGLECKHFAMQIKSLGKGAELTCRCASVASESAMHALKVITK